MYICAMSTTEEQTWAYEDSRRRIDALARQLNIEQRATVVPCCPLWTVNDVVGHLTGLLEDRRDANMPSGSFGDWTAAQVARQRDLPMSQVLDKWQELAAMEIDGPPSLAALSFDIVTHEHDIYQALGIAGDRSTYSVTVGAERAGERMRSMLTEGSAPGVLATTEDGTHLCEGAETPIGLETSCYALLRLATGRMSRAQAQSLGWDSDPSPVLDALFADGFFVLQPYDVAEVGGF
jgi:uncharacterized protein (TIGR03083 family)